MNKKILLIDDSKTQLHSLKIILTRAGYEIITADNGISGIESAYKNNPDLIVSDIVMPNINGYHLCRLLKNDPRTKDIPIVLLTILSGKMDKFWGLKAGADKYINKESEPQELISSIEEVLKNTPEKNINNNEIEEVNIDEEVYQARVNKILDQSLIDSTIMNEFRNLAEFTSDDEALIKGTFDLIDAIIDYDLAGIFFNSCDEKEQKVLNIDMSSSRLSEDSIKKLSQNFFNNIFDEMKEDAFSHKLFNTDKSSIKVIDNIETFKTSLVFPVKKEGKVIGGIALFAQKNVDYENLQTFKIILDELKLLMQIKSLHSRTRLLTIVDPLTNLYNRRYFNEILEKEYSRARRYNNEFSIAMFDIDNFKRLNDTYGHQFGDKVLSEVAAIIISSLRNTDFAFRYGGEEMTALLTNSNCEQAIIPIERIRKKIEDKIFKFKDLEVQVTVSAGMASTQEQTESANQLIKLADSALYKAKETGKNKVVIYEKE